MQIIFICFYIYKHTAISTLMFCDVYVYTYLWGALGTNHTNYSIDRIESTLHHLLILQCECIPTGTVFESRWWRLDVWTFAFILNAWPLLRYQRYVRIFMEKKVLDTQYGEEDWIIKGEVPTSCNLPVGFSNAMLCVPFCHLALVNSGSCS